MCLNKVGFEATFSSVNSTFRLIPIPEWELYFRGRTLTPFDEENGKMTDSAEMS